MSKYSIENVWKVESLEDLRESWVAIIHNNKNKNKRKNKEEVRPVKVKDPVDTLIRGVLVDILVNNPDTANDISKAKVVMYNESQYQFDDSGDLIITYKLHKYNYHGEYLGYEDRDITFSSFEYLIDNDMESASMNTLECKESYVKQEYEYLYSTALKILRRRVLSDSSESTNHKVKDGYTFILNTLGLNKAYIRR